MHSGWLDYETLSGCLCMEMHVSSGFKRLPELNKIACVAGMIANGYKFVDFSYGWCSMVVGLCIYCVCCTALHTSVI